jgi:hypothetical protein
MSKETEATVEQCIERMALAGARDSLPEDGMFNSEQLSVMACDRLPTYRKIARVMFLALFRERASSED